MRSLALILLLSPLLMGGTCYVSSGGLENLSGSEAQIDDLLGRVQQLEQHAMGLERRVRQLEAQEGGE